MNPEKIAFFKEKYNQLDDEELIAAGLNLENLSDEAATALKEILSDKNFLATVSSEIPTTADVLLAVPSYVDEQEQARKLWRSKLVWSSRSFFMLLPVVPGQQFVKSNGALISSLLTVLLALLGLYVGTIVARSICADENKTIAQKKQNLWMTFPSVFVGIMILSFVVG